METLLPASRSLNLFLSRQNLSSAFCIIFFRILSVFFLSLDDHSRVPLPLIDDVKHSDYINANYLHVCIYFVS